MSPLSYLLLIPTVLSLNVDQQHERDGRWFIGGTVTETVIAKQVKTEITPSSCVVVEPSLPPCRNLRALNVAPSPATRIVPTQQPWPEAKSIRWLSSDDDRRQVVQPSEPGVLLVHTGTGATPVAKPSESKSGYSWGSLLGYTTVTETLVQLQTKRMFDPDTMVTFSVTGCQPSRLPFDLPYCRPRNVERPNISIVERVGTAATPAKIVTNNIAATSEVEEMEAVASPRADHQIGGEVMLQINE